MPARLLYYQAAMLQGCNASATRLQGYLSVLVMSGSQKQRRRNFDCVVVGNGDD